jgi:imidazoleglycerol-phosphate dehydratase
MRQVNRTRKTKETDIALSLNLDGTGIANIDTGIGFFDHMLHALAKHGHFDLTLHCRGDLHVDDHHTVEDVALTLGAAFDEALGQRRGIARYSHAYAPLDEALARAVVDLGGRPFPVLDLRLEREQIGGWATENVRHFFASFANSGRMALHVDVLRGDNDHHRIEAAFKATALALRAAVIVRGNDVPSTKGVL